MSYAVSVLGVLGSMPATFGVPLSLGGPAAAVWAWLVGSLMASCISASGKMPPQEDPGLTSNSCRACIRVPHGWRNVFCHQERCSAGACRCLVLDHRMV